jgi:DNA-binding MarR family transcriptional regulator
MSQKTLRFFKPNRFLRELFLLIGFEQNPALSQHDIARVAGISSSMAHNYVKYFVEQELITIEGKTNRTMRYLVTPTGKQRKQELLALYSEEVVHLYTIAKNEFEKKLRSLVQHGMNTAVLFGAAATGELVYNASLPTPLQIIGVVDNDPHKHHQKFGELEVLPPTVIESLHPDGVIITAFGKPDEIYAEIKHLQDQGIEIVRL